MHGGVKNMRGEKDMIYKEIKFEASPFLYELFFEDRITLVGGDSGTGKTVCSCRIKVSRGQTAFIH